MRGRIVLRPAGARARVGGACRQHHVEALGPAQAASRSFLARLIPEGKNGEIFGLYATTGRVVSFLSPALFALFIGIGATVTGEENTQYWGILGIVLILAAGFAVMLPVKEHAEHRVS